MKQTGNTSIQRLPMVIKCLSLFDFSDNRWSHEYQEATIEKILRFLKGKHDLTDSPGSKGQKKKE